MKGPRGKFVNGAGAPFSKIPNGVPGVETRMTVVYNGGVHPGRISLNRFVELMSTAPAKLGDKVFTIGFPQPDLLGVRPKYSEGVIAALTGLEDDATRMQVSIPIQPGNSGGPVVDTHGHVVGIVAASAAVGIFLKYTGTLPQSVNWAVKADYALPLLASYTTGDAPRISGFDITDQVTKAVCHIEVSKVEASK